jgi:hypothetical protein
MNLPRAERAVLIDPSYDVFLQDRLFEVADPEFNRDDMLLPFARLKVALEQRGVPVHTPDILDREPGTADRYDYWSLGMTGRYPDLARNPQVRLRGFLVMEPPLIAPDLYHRLPELTKAFDSVYVHNVDGDGYSLDGVERGRLRKFYWPQPYDNVIDDHWRRGGRENRVVAISGSHNPMGRRPEYYSARIEAVAEMSRSGAVDLFGRGWERWWGRRTLFWAYWRHRAALMRAYRGSCVSKLETLSRYRFCLCFENMPMRGYITEKIFDCFYAGTVPLYMGAPDVASHLPAATYVDASRYASWTDLKDDVLSMSDAVWQGYRDAARQFLQSGGGRRYAYALDDIIS